MAQPLVIFLCCSQGDLYLQIKESVVSDGLYWERKQNNFILNNCTPSESCWPIHRAFPFAYQVMSLCTNPLPPLHTAHAQHPLVTMSLCSYTNVPLLLQVHFRRPLRQPILSACSGEQSCINGFLLDQQSHPHRLPYKWTKIFNSNAL